MNKPTAAFSKMACSPRFICTVNWSAASADVRTSSLLSRHEALVVVARSHG